MDAYDTTPEDKEGDLRLWWIPQIGMKGCFVRKVESVEQAAFLHDVLADYDLFQFENKVKPDYSNTGGLAVFEGGEWSDWYDHDTGNDFSEHLRERADRLETAKVPAPGA